MMKRRIIRIDRLVENAELIQSSIPGQCVVEIAGDRRVLVENHLGVKGYGREKIVVKVKYGTVCVVGDNLEMIRLTKEQLVITGRIDSVQLCREGQK